MRLQDILSKLERLGDDDVVYARRPWTLESEARIVQFPEDVTIPRMLADDPSFQYFLEGPLLRDLQLQLEQSGRSSGEVIEALLYYAENDAFPD
jgi:hypothetical protein